MQVFSCTLEGVVELTIATPMMALASSSADVLLHAFDELLHAHVFVEPESL